MPRLTAIGTPMSIRPTTTANKIATSMGLVLRVKMFNLSHSLFNLMADNQAGLLAAHQPHEDLDKAEQEQSHAKGEHEIGNEPWDLFVIIAIVHDRLDPAQPFGKGDINGLIPSAVRGAFHLFKACRKPTARCLR